MRVPANGWLSQHLAVLESAGLVVSRRQGRYELHDKALRFYTDILGFVKKHDVPMVPTGG